MKFMVLGAINPNENIESRVILHNVAFAGYSTYEWIAVKTLLFSCK